MRCKVSRRRQFANVRFRVQNSQVNGRRANVSPCRSCMAVLLNDCINCRDIFINTDDGQTLRSFVRAANKLHANLRHAKISDTLWGLYNLTLTEEYARSQSYTLKTLVTTIGKQPGSRVWALNPKLQIDHTGKEIPHEQQKYFW